MMQLKYMVLDTDEAAEKLLANWSPKPTEIHFYRASGNYVHTFKTAGNCQFVRFYRAEERDMATLKSVAFEDRTPAQFKAWGEALGRFSDVQHG